MRRLAGRLFVTIGIGAFLVLALSSPCLGQNYEREYILLRGHSTYRLTLSITPSLYEYYQGKSHQLTPRNFATFVTPYVMSPPSGDIRSISSDDEEFVNLVLMLVHQIPYQVVQEPRYPVETIVDDRGDCDLFSFIASSLIKAQDMDVVLFYYEQESHMNVGVHLPSPPRDARSTVTYVDYGGTRYYMAECTGNDWQNGWRVGECPQELEGAQVTVVTLENCEQIAPGQVSSSFGALDSSTISLVISSKLVIEGSTVTIRGQISLPNPNGTIILYAAANGNWISIGTVTPDSNGRYEFPWTTTLDSSTLWGQFQVKASWSGNDEHAGADSNIATLYVVPKVLVFALGGLVVVGIIAVVLGLMYKTTHPPEIQDSEAVYQTL